MVQSCSRVTGASGLKLRPSPSTIRLAAAQDTASAYQAPAGTSAKEVPAAAEPLAMRYRAVTTMERVMVWAGLKEPSPMPLKISWEATKPMASAAQWLPSTSGKDLVLSTTA